MQLVRVALHIEDTLRQEHAFIYGGGEANDL